jgi:Amt family ammonium transporter
MWKDRPGHFLIFVIFWATFVYEPIARWTWSPDGWSNTWGTLDFAGGSGIHICAGGTVLAHSLFHKFLLKRYELWLRFLPGSRAEESSHRQEDPGTDRSATPNNAQEKSRDESRSDCVSVLIGTLLLWVGWFGFNGGRALGASVRAVSACVSTHISACTGAAVFCILGANYSRDNSKERRASFKFSITHFCNGAIIALVAITPAAGFVPPTVAPLFGAIPTIICFVLEDITEISERLGDEQEIFVIHGVGGFLGMLMTGFFARGYIAALDGFTSPDAHRGGWDGNWFQLL